MYLSVCVHVCMCVLVCLGCHNKIPQIGQLKQQKCISHSSEAWKPWIKLPAKFPCEPLSLACRQQPSDCAPMWPFLCVRAEKEGAPGCLFLRTSISWRPHLTPLTSQGPIPKGHQYGGLRLIHKNLWGAGDEHLATVVCVHPHYNESNVSYVFLTESGRREGRARGLMEGKKESTSCACRISHTENRYFVQLICTKNLAKYIIWKCSFCLFLELSDRCVLRTCS